MGNTILLHGLSTQPLKEIKSRWSGSGSVTSRNCHWILVSELLCWFLQGFPQTRHKPSQTEKYQKVKSWEVPPMILCLWWCFNLIFRMVPNSINRVTNSLSSSVHNFFCLLHTYKWGPHCHGHNFQLNSHYSTLFFPT